MDSQSILRRLVLLRNDPQLARDARVLALAGDADAQYALGLIYAEARGVEEDLVEACAWLTLATLRGDRDAQELQWIVSERMTPQQLGLAEERSGVYEQQILAAGGVASS